MRSNNIVIIIYNYQIYIECNNDIDVINIDKNIIKEGRINNIKEFINCLKQSKIIKTSSFKLVDDNILMLYFGNYNDMELNNILNGFKDKGYEKVKLKHISKVLDSSYSYLFHSNGYYYLFDIDNYVLYSKFLNSSLLDLNKNYIMDYNSYQKLSLFDSKNIYYISNVYQYIKSCLIKRNK